MTIILRFLFGPGLLCFDLYIATDLTHMSPQSTDTRVMVFLLTWVKRILGMKDQINGQLWIPHKHEIERGVPSGFMLAAIICVCQNFNIRSQSAFCSTSRVPNKVRLNRSVIPFPCGWYGDVLLFTTPSKLHGSQMTAASKLLPWSECNRSGMP